MVLMLIGGGITTIILCVIASMGFGHGMPDWAESLMSAIVGGTLVKLADVLSALVALANSAKPRRARTSSASPRPLATVPLARPTIRST